MRSEKSEGVYAAHKRTCPFCKAPIWLALTGKGVMVLGADPAKETAYQHDCERPKGNLPITPALVAERPETGPKEAVCRSGSAS